MKKIIGLSILIIILISYAKSETDSLIINFTNNSQQKIALSDIVSIKFENITDVKQISSSISDMKILGNKPNPFSEFTYIEVILENTGTVNIKIFDKSGTCIRELICNDCSAGKNSIYWDCLDEQHLRVSSGVYYYEVHFKNLILTKKMILVN